MIAVNVKQGECNKAPPQSVGMGYVPLMITGAA
jgi:hypothetical protein